MDIIMEALAKGQTSLSEHDSKKFLASFGIPVTREELARSVEEAVEAANRIGFPVVLKGTGPELLHKTEKRLIELDLRYESEVREAYRRIVDRAGKAVEGVLVQEMVDGQRELVAGLVRDPQFGPCVMFGLGGIFTEILEDVTFRVAPLSERDAHDMMDSIRARKILEPVRGMEAVNRSLLAAILITLGRIGLDYPEVREIDINPLKIRGREPVAVDAMVVLQKIKSR